MRAGSMRARRQLLLQRLSHRLVHTRPPVILRKAGERALHLVQVGYQPVLRQVQWVHSQMQGPLDDELTLRGRGAFEAP